MEFSTSTPRRPRCAPISSGPSAASLARPFAWTGSPSRSSARRIGPSTPGPVRPGPPAELASALKGWQKLRFEVTEEATATTEGERYSYTPTLGVFHAVTGMHGDIMVPEDRHQARHDRSPPSAAGTWPTAIDDLLGKAWDDELEPFRYAGDGAPRPLAPRGRVALSASRPRERR